MTVSVPPAGALTVAVLVSRFSDTVLPFGDKVILWTTVVAVATSVTVTGPPATLIGALQPPPATLTAPFAPVWSTHLKANERPVMPFADDLQISIVPFAAAYTGSWLEKLPAAGPMSMGSSHNARNLRGFVRNRMDRPL
jgi:hypothetical protein